MRQQAPVLPRWSEQNPVISLGLAVLEEVLGLGVGLVWSQDADRRDDPVHDGQATVVMR